MPLMEVEKQNLRRHLNYGAIGLYRLSPAGGTLAPVNTGLRFFNSWSQLEYKMNNFLPNEEAALTGRSYGAIGFVNSNPVNFSTPVDPGSTIVINISSDLFSASPVTLNYTVVQGDTLLSICGSLAQQAALNSVFISAGFYCLNNYGAGPYGQLSSPLGQYVSLPIVSFLGPTGSCFSLTTSGTGNTAPQIVSQGMPINPSLTSGMTVPSTTLWGYIPILNYLEDQMAGQVSDNLSVYKANDATLRMSEAKDRIRLYKFYVQRLSDFISIQVNPESPSRTNSMTMGNTRNWSAGL